jgi:hypothetical protein
MNCYYHPGTTAVGLCKHCQRGLCADCAALVDDSLACKDRHEEQVRLINQMFEQNIANSKRVKGNYLRSALFYFLSGGAFAAFGAWQIKWAGAQGIFLLLIGLFLLYAALANFIESRKIKK